MGVFPAASFRLNENLISELSVIVRSATGTVTVYVHTFVSSVHEKTTTAFSIIAFSKLTGCEVENCNVTVLPFLAYCPDVPILSDKNEMEERPLSIGARYRTVFVSVWVLLAVFPPASL